MLLFGMALSWFMALIGLGTGNPEAAQAAAFPLLALLVFASNAFVPTSTMPTWLQGYANHQPVSATITAIRALLNGGPTAGKVVTAVLWTLAFAAVFAVLAVRRYRKAT
jgi:ABC-2 type transport system permease protein/oleandomycin transport system permease protein